MWEWIIDHTAEIILVVGMLERFAKETPEDFTFFGIPIGKYDNQVSDFVKMILRAVFPKK